MVAKLNWKRRTAALLLCALAPAISSCVGPADSSDDESIAAMLLSLQDDGDTKSSIQVDGDSITEFGRGLGGAKRVGHQCAATGTELNEKNRCGRFH